MRRKFVLLPYVKKKNLREEMKELMEIGRNFINGEKEYLRREKEFKENFQALVRKKEEKEKREREKDERKAREEKEKREKVMIEKENTKTSFSRVESDIDNILSSLENPCEDVLAEKSMFGTEPDIDMNVSSIDNTEDCFTKKVEEETNKEEESFMTPPESMAEKESLKGDYNTLNSSLQKSQKPNFVMLLPNLDWCLIREDEHSCQSKKLLSEIDPVDLRIDFLKKEEMMDTIQPHTSPY
ncbi:uncharacterized protein [Phaseolus vulgaris]|uniref:uncharacterized protein n=1 Tax=Phaseolus vulgaris TaxID=3885 RepID=UPI0035C9D86F